jgi:hypothetical protein
VQGAPPEALKVPAGQGAQTLSAFGDAPGGHTTQPHEAAEKPWPGGQAEHGKEEAL